MNSIKFMNFPSWVFPDGTPRSLEIGKCSAMGYDGTKVVIENSPYAKNSMKRYIYRVLPPTMLRPYIWKLPLYFKNISAIARNMGEPDSHIIAEEFAHAVSYQDNAIKYERFQGNSICSFHAGIDCIAVPRNRSTVAIYSIQGMNLELSKSFQLPISQIQYSDRRGRHLLVRSMKGIHSIDIDAGETVDLLTDSEPMHLAASNVLPLFAVVNGDGAINVWDMNRLTSVMGPLEHNRLDLREKRRVCEFGPHPKTLAVGEYQGISLIDLRTENTKSLFPFDRLNSLKFSPANQFHLAATSKSNTILVDFRYTKSPMLDWELNDCRESQVFLEYHSEPHGILVFTQYSILMEGYTGKFLNTHTDSGMILRPWLIAHIDFRHFIIINLKFISLDPLL